MYITSPVNVINRQPIALEVKDKLLTGPEIVKTFFLMHDYELKVLAYSVNGSYPSGLLVTRFASKIITSKK